MGLVETIDTNYKGEALHKRLGKGGWTCERMDGNKYINGSKYADRNYRNGKSDHVKRGSSWKKILIGSSM